VAVKFGDHDALKTEERLYQAFGSTKALVPLVGKSIITVLDSDRQPSEQFVALVFEAGESCVPTPWNVQSQLVSLNLDHLRQVWFKLQLVHSNGYVHRDLRPENILVCGAGSPDPETFLIDFGFAMKINDTPRLYQGSWTTASQRVLRTLASGQPDVVFAIEDDLESFLKMVLIHELPTNFPVYTPHLKEYAGNLFNYWASEPFITRFSKLSLDEMKKFIEEFIFDIDKEGYVGLGKRKIVVESAEDVAVTPDRPPREAGGHTSQKAFRNFLKSISGNQPSSQSAAAPSTSLASQSSRKL
jgi:hypothetical protein